MMRRLAARLLGDYAVYRMYSHAAPASNEQPQPAEPTPTPPARIALLDDINELAASPHADLRPLAAYAGGEAYVFGIWTDGVLAGVAAYWWGRRYAARGFWPLKPGQAKLVQLNIAAALRGRGLAAPLVAASTRVMHELGFSPLYARIWHSLHASRRALERAGWHNFAIVVEIDPFRRGKRTRWTIPLGAAAQYRAFHATRQHVSA